MGYPNDDIQDDRITSTEDGACARKNKVADIAIVACAVIGALCVLPIVSMILAGLVKLFFGLLAGALGLAAGLVSLALGLALGAIGLVVGLLAGLAGLLVSPPGLVLIAIVVYLQLRD